MNQNRFITSAKKRTDRTDKDKQELYTFVILADSPGYRMKSYGPSSLISFNRKKLIDIQIQSITTTFTNFEIILCCGFDIDKVYRHIKTNYSHINIRIVENQIYNNSNSCESARIAINNTNNNKIFIIDGNLMLNNVVFDTIETKESYVYAEKYACENLHVGINVNEHNNVEHFSYGAYLTWSEILFLHNKDIIESFRKVINNIDFKNKFIFEALNELIKQDYIIKYIVNENKIRKVNNIKTYHEIKEKV